MIGRTHVELSIKQVRCDWERMIAVCGHPKAAFRVPHDVVLAHHSLQPLLADVHAVATQLAQYPGTAVAASGLRVDGLDVHQQRRLAQATP